MVKFIPKNGNKRATDVAYPCCYGLNNFNIPYGTVRRGTWATATIAVITNAKTIFWPTIYLPTHPTVVNIVEA